VSNIWIVDNNSDRVYEFTAAASRTNGSHSPASSFPLAAGNTNPQGIADPPAATSQSAIHNPQSAILHDTALLGITDELAIVFAKKRK
jgi:hypothetical protein